MHRIYMLPLLILLSLTVLIATAQDDPMPDDVSPRPTSTPENVVTDDTEAPPVKIGSLMSSGGGIFSVDVSEGSDFCLTATEATGGGATQYDVADFTQSANDPVLHCMWGSPSDLRGYRTVWYKFTPNANGIMTIDTLPSSPNLTTAYDTVLAVHTGGCDTGLTTVACSDDAMAFSSKITMNVRRNTTYYIEVADWQAGGNATKTLTILLQIEPFDSLWQIVDAAPQDFIGTSRHASVVVGSDIYFLGGRDAHGNLLRNFQRLNTDTGEWSQMVLDIPGEGLVNTTAVYLPAGSATGTQGRIYIPGGSAHASDQVYTRDHYIYDFAAGIWILAGTPVGGAHVTEPFAYAAAVPNNARDGYFLTGGVVGPGYPITTTSQARDQVLFYQPAFDSWTEASAMQSPRYGHVAANVNGQICVAGGLNLLTATNEIELVTRVECASGVFGTGWSTVAPMNVPRYFAHSGVTSDGRWFVYGGIDGTGVAVPEVEVYDPGTNTWSILGLAYDLGGQDGNPLVWPGGGFVGNYLWAAGGSYDPVGNNTNPHLLKVRMLSRATYLPVIFNNQFGSNHTFDTAWYRPFNTGIQQNFASAQEFVNVYSFYVDQLRTVQVALRDVINSSTANLSLYVYGENKLILASSESPFERDKTITIPMAPGKYYVVVKNLSIIAEDIEDFYWLGIGDP